MTLIFSNHRFQYEVERLFRNFINEPGIKLSTDKADAQGDFCLTERWNTPAARSFPWIWCAKENDSA